MFDIETSGIQRLTKAVEKQKKSKISVAIRNITFFDVSGRKQETFRETSFRPDGRFGAPLFLNRWRGNPSRLQCVCIRL